MYLEIDGKIHGELEQPSKSTLTRNKDLSGLYAPYTILSEDDAKLLKLDKNDLAVYLVRLEYTKWLATHGD